MATGIGRAACRLAPAMTGLQQPWPIANPCSSMMVTQNSLAGCRAPAAARSRTRPGSSAPRPCASPGRSARPRRVSSGSVRFPRTGMRSLPRLPQPGQGPGHLEPLPGTALRRHRRPGTCHPAEPAPPAPGDPTSLRRVPPARCAPVPPATGRATAGSVRLARSGQPPGNAASAALRALPSPAPRWPTHCRPDHRQVAVTGSAPSPGRRRPGLVSRHRACRCLRAGIVRHRRCHHARSPSASPPSPGPVAVRAAAWPTVWASVVPPPGPCRRPPSGSPSWPGRRGWRCGGGPLPVPSP